MLNTYQIVVMKTIEKIQSHEGYRYNFCGFLFYTNLSLQNFIIELTPSIH